MMPESGHLRRYQMSVRQPDDPMNLPKENKIRVRQPSAGWLFSDDQVRYRF